MSQQGRQEPPDEEEEDEEEEDDEDDADAMADRLAAEAKASIAARKKKQAELAKNTVTGVAFTGGVQERPSGGMGMPGPGDAPARKRASRFKARKEAERRGE